MIYLHWKKYQQKLVQSLKEVKEGVVIAGDGRHDMTVWGTVPNMAPTPYFAAHCQRLFTFL